MGNKNLNLIRELALTDFKLKYNGSVFGYLWSLVKPLALFTVLYFVFTKVIRLGGEVPYYPVYLLLGITLWAFFAETTNTCMLSIVGRGDLIRKVYFPKIVLPISSGISAFITLLLNLVIVFAFILYLKIELTSRVFLLPFLLIEFYLFSLGVSFFLASLFVRYRDLSHIWEVFSQLLFYATPIIYPITLVPGKILPFQMISPISQIIQDARNIIISPEIKTSPSILGLWSFVPYALTLLVFIFGYFLFRFMATKFAEEI